MDRPFTIEIPSPEMIPALCDNHIVRKPSNMAGQFADGEAFEALLAQDDSVLYEVYEFKRPEVSGELLSGISVIHPGKVGDEYFMTKGHFHTVLDTAEIYYCLKGNGYMVMETPEGDSDIKPLKPGSVLYVPPRWAHRSVNVGSDADLVTFFVCPGHAGHDYGTIETQGFRKLVVDHNGQPVFVDNPRWLPPEER